MMAHRITRTLPGIVGRDCAVGLFLIACAHSRCSVAGDGRRLGDINRGPQSDKSIGARVLNPGEAIQNVTAER